MSRMKNSDINAALTDLRKDLRDGSVTIYTRPENTNFRTILLQYLGIDDFTPEHMNPQTIRRFETLLEVPNTPKSQDNIAWAIQNFINRRGDPWRHVRMAEAEAEMASPSGAVV